MTPNPLFASFRISQYTRSFHRSDIEADDTGGTSIERRRFLGQLAAWLPLGAAMATSITTATETGNAATERPMGVATPVTGILAPDLRDRRPDRIFYGHTAPIRCVVFSTDGKQILSGSDDQTAVLRDAATGKVIQVFRSPTSEPIIDAVFQTSGGGIITKTSGHTAHWNSDGTIRHSFRGQSGRGVIPVAVNPRNPDEVTAFGPNFSMRVIDTRTGVCAAHCVGHSAPITTVAFSNDGLKLLTGSFDQLLIVWNFPGLGVSEAARQAAQTKRSDLREEVDARSNGAMVLTRRNTIHNGSAVLSAAFSPDGELALIGLDDHSIVLRDLRYGERIRSFFLPNHRIARVAISPDGTRALAAAGEILAIWNLR